VYHAPVENHVFVVHGDITQIQADALAFSTSGSFEPTGDLYSSFAERFPGFRQAYARLGRAHQGDAVGTTHWIAPNLVVVVAAKPGIDPETVSRRVVRNAVREAVARLRGNAHARGRDRRLLIALPAFLTGKGVHAERRVALATLQIQAARDVLRERSCRDVDIVFTVYEATTYDAYMLARRRLGAVAGAVADIPGDLAAAVRRNRAVLFVGAGLSSAAGLEPWSALAARLEAALDLPKELHPRTADEYLDIAQWYRDAAGRPGSPLPPLEELIRQRYADDTADVRPTLAHYLLLSLPFRYVVTTNYDELLERALRAQRRSFRKIARDADVPGTGGSDELYVVKLHGDASAGPIVLSRDDYDDFFHAHPAMALLLEGLLLNQTFVFVGYSLRDPNFRQIYNRIARMLDTEKRPTYSLAYELVPGHPSIEQWRRKGLDPIPFDHDGRRFLRWVDALSDLAGDAGSPRLFLADTRGAAAGPLLPLRAKLLETGALVSELAGRRRLSREHAEVLAHVLGFLTESGWRPAPDARWGAPTDGRNPLIALWQRVAQRLPAPERARVLRAALEHTQSLEEARELQGLLPNKNR
jgi:SIR2-like protein